MKPFAIFQMAMVYRYVVKGKPVERFWRFFTPEKHDAKTLVACIIEPVSYTHLDVYKRQILRNG